LLDIFLDEFAATVVGDAGRTGRTASAGPLVRGAVRLMLQ
jgi:hypothetical protein